MAAIEDAIVALKRACEAEHFKLESVLILTTGADRDAHDEALVSAVRVTAPRRLLRAILERQIEALDSKAGRK